MLKKPVGKAFRLVDRELLYDNGDYSDLDCAAIEVHYPTTD